MYKEKVKPIENETTLAFGAIVAGIVLYTVGFGVVGALEPGYKWIFQLLILLAVTSVIYFLFSRIMGDYYYAIDDGILYCISRTGSRSRTIAELPVSAFVNIGEYKKDAPEGAKVYNAVKSFSKKNTRTAIFEANGQTHILHFEPTDELIAKLK